ncbi:hypothetical protein DS901_07630 [Loktanella sp. D2R18]|uniref:hypothetical protein n=1 Tax=Rhodobacterales TaxID=204455 RepID=UPI000DEBB98B|nr:MULTISPECIES: hypothetical protein [Rhodobacterales]MDO6589641.1 hypothetical protein [Yoonia sp. 1_MG-2023]RBW44276.1 hypothetical protein DS901_07630 [Loktanella sp. D2R18]
MRSEILALSLICIPAVGIADTIPEGAVNTYFAQQIVLEGYAGCDGIGQIAFKTDLFADDVALFVDALERTRTSASAPVEEVCYRQEMRGTDRIRIEVSCGEDWRVSTGSLSQIRIDQSLEQMQLSVHATLVSCMTPTSYQVMEGAWQATTNNGMTTTVDEGVFQPWDSDAACPQKAGPRQTSASIRYAVAGTWGNPVDYFGRTELFEHYDQPYSPAFFRLDLRDIPLRGAVLDDLALNAGARMTFIVSSEEETLCPDGICSIPQPRYVRYLRVNPAVCR